MRAPAAYLVHSDEDYILLIKRLYALDMVSFTVRPKVVGGCFGSPKSDGSIRFLFDGRRTNAIWVPSPDVELPSPDLLAKLEAPPGEKIFVCKSDLDNFYHRLRLPEWMRPYFALPSSGWRPRAARLRPRRLGVPMLHYAPHGLVALGFPGAGLP